MNKTIHNAFFCLSFAFLIALAQVANAHAQGPLSEVLRRMDVHNKNVTSIRADVIMEKHNPQLNVTDTYVGSTSYLPNAKGKRYMRLDWSKPTVEQISVIGDDYELYKPSINQVYQGKVKKAKTSAGAGNALAFMNMTREQLKSNYDVEFVNEEKVRDGTPTAHILLKPKVATSYKTAELWIDKDGMPRQAKVVEQNGDTTTVLLENIGKNIPIKTAIFTLSYDRKKVKYQKV